MDHGADLRPLFGFFSYGVYDFTIWSTLRNWNATITVADVT